MKLWEGRFSGEMDPSAWTLNASIGFDQRMAYEDVQGSKAWAEALVKAAVLEPAEGQAIQQGLDQILSEVADGDFAILPSDEDIHTAVERRLGELVGEVAGRLHTGRSRNDQVATDFRLWILGHLPNLDDAIKKLQAVLVQRALDDLGVVISGYTHLQRAQPVALSHWWMSFFWPLQRDRERFSGARAQTAALPLGSAALAGTPYPVDRFAMAAALGFDQPTENSLDAVSDRDFVADFLYAAALLGVHLSRLSEALVIFASTEFGLIELSDQFSTGSSLMPQKKNPDLFELARGKAGPAIGRLTGFLATYKGLPSTYDKDLQEDKLPVFQAYDEIMVLLPALAGAIKTLAVNPDRAAALLDGNLMATDLADYLVSKGRTFRAAHKTAGAAVAQAFREGRTLDQFQLQELQSIDPVIEADVAAVFNPEGSVNRRNVYGGTAFEAVKDQIKEAKNLLNV
jgi:argininosuccinate lyase